MEKYYYQIVYTLKSEPYYISRVIYISSYNNFEEFKALMRHILAEGNFGNFSGTEGFSFIDLSDIKNLNIIKISKEEFEMVLNEERYIEGVPYFTDHAAEFMFEDLNRK